MAGPSGAQLTQLLEAWRKGDSDAADKLVPLVYAELRRMAASKLQSERGGHTLQPTALVHEAYVRLVGDQQFDGRGHFFAAAAEAMRRILIESARRQASLKRGGGLLHRDLLESELIAPELSDDVLALDEALEQLASVDAEAAELVKLRYFAGMTMPEAASAMGMAPRTAERLWTYARVWLRREIRARR